MSRLGALLKPWRRASRAFAGRARRERLLLAGVGAAALLGLGDALWLGPDLRQLKQARTQADQAEQALVQARAALAEQARVQALAREQRSAELSQLRQQLQALGEQPQALEGARMLALIEQLLQRQGTGLRLLSLQALPDPAAAAATTAPRLYRHAIELKLAGSYAELHRYLQELARADQRLRVRSLGFAVARHPEVELSLQVETLSPEPAWLTL